MNTPFVEGGRLKELELVCDAIGSLTLHQLGMDPSRLTDAIEKVTQFNRRSIGAAIDETNYPSLVERRAFAHEILRWLRGSSGGLTCCHLFGGRLFPLELLERVDNDLVG